MINAKHLSALKTATGTTVTKYLEAQPMRKGFGRVAKKIQYPANSSIAQLGVDTVVIRNAGKEGKHIMAFNGDRCVASGLTNPAYSFERPVQNQLKAIFDAVKLLRSKSIY